MGSPHLWWSCYFKHHFAREKNKAAPVWPKGLRSEKEALKRQRRKLLLRPKLKRSFFVMEWGEPQIIKTIKWGFFWDLLTGWIYCKDLLVFYLSWCALQNSWRSSVGLSVCRLPVLTGPLDWSSTCQWPARWIKASLLCLQPNLGKPILKCAVSIWALSK